LIPPKGYDHIDHMKEKLDRAVAQNTELKKDILAA